MIGLNLTIVASQAFQAFSQLRWTAAIYVLISSSRLSAAILLVAFHHHPSALQWGYAYFASTVLIATTAVCMVCTKLGLPQVPRRPSHAEFIEGLYFSIGMSAQTIYNDIDKTMLARLGSLGATGIYGAAYRLIDVSFSPVAALLSATYPNFFRTGLGGVRSSFSYAKPLLTRAITYAVVVCVGILLCAGIVPSILGAEYARTTEALRWLSFLPVLKAAHYFLSDTLTGAGYQSVRSAIQACVAIFNISINLWLIPAYSWRGAAWSSIASDALLACGVGTAVWILGRSPVNPAAVVYNQ
jgi:O-antigen/teichoic acid export membrane protein